MLEENIKIDANTASVNQPQVHTITSKDELLNAFKVDFATSANKIYINSLQKEVSFREITVKEQKTLTRIMAANEKRKDIIFDAQCALIQQLCLDPTFDIYKVSEFDRLKLLIAVYQTNMFSNDIKFTCPECGTENTYKIDFEKTINRLNEFDLTPKTYEYENKTHKYSAVIVYPTVRLVSEFHKMFAMQNRAKSRRDARMNDTMENVDYINLFIDSMDVLDKSKNTLMKINLRQFPLSQLEEIFSVFSQDLLYSDGGLIKYIVDNYIKTFNDSFDKHECFSCGTIHENGNEDNINNFL